MIIRMPKPSPENWTSSWIPHRAHGKTMPLFWILNAIACFEGDSHGQILKRLRAWVQSTMRLSSSSDIGFKTMVCQLMHATSCCCLRSIFQWRYLINRPPGLICQFDFLWYRLSFYQSFKQTWRLTSSGKWRILPVKPSYLPQPHRWHTFTEEQLSTSADLFYELMHDSKTSLSQNNTII